MPVGRSQLRLPQSRDHALRGSTHYGYCVHGSHLLPMDHDRLDVSTPATRCAAGIMPVAVSLSNAPPTATPSSVMGRFTYLDFNTPDMSMFCAMRIRLSWPLFRRRWRSHRGPADGSNRWRWPKNSAGASSFRTGRSRCRPAQAKTEAVPAGPRGDRPTCRLRQPWVAPPAAHLLLVQARGGALVPMGATCVLMTGLRCTTCWPDIATGTRGKFGAQGMPAIERVRSSEPGGGCRPCLGYRLQDCARRRARCAPQLSGIRRCGARTTRGRSAARGR